MKPRSVARLRAVTAVLTIAAVGFVAYGTWSAWARNSDIDTQAREDEYVLFRQGVYPHARIESPPPTSGRVFSVYPPYTFPMLAFFFEPGGPLQARILIQLLSLASLMAMGRFAWRTLAPYGESVAMLGAVTGAAMAGNATALMVGQFSIICTGLIVLQIVCLQRRKPLVAGVFWAVAMIKPQIALPFGLLFLFPGQLVGALVGTVILAVLTVLACAWTEVPIRTVVEYWLWGMSLNFTNKAGGLNPGGVAAALGIDPRVTQRISVVLLAVSAVPLGLFMQRLGERALVPVAGLCSVAGMFFAYHRQYDNVMLFPAIVALIALTAASRKSSLVLLMAVTLAWLLLPQRLVICVPWHGVLQGAVLVAMGVLPLRMAANPVSGHPTPAGLSTASCDPQP